MAEPRRPAGPGWRRDRGAALLETAIALPMVLLVSVGIFELLHFLNGLSVVTEIVIAVSRRFICMQLKRRCCKRIHHQSYDASRI